MSVLSSLTVIHLVSGETHSDHYWTKQYIIIYFSWIIHFFFHPEKLTCTDFWWKGKNGSTVNTSWDSWQKWNIQWSQKWVNILTDDENPQSIRLKDKWMYLSQCKLCMSLHTCCCKLHGAAGSMPPSMHVRCRLNYSIHEHELYQK